MNEASPDPLEEASQTLSTGALLVTALRDLRSTQQADSATVTQAVGRLEQRQDACEREMREVRIALSTLLETAQTEARAARAARDSSWPVLLLSAWQAADARVQAAFIILGGVVVAALGGINLPDLLKAGMEIYRGL